jgi:hypothetical protein
MKIANFLIIVFGFIILSGCSMSPAKTPTPTTNSLLTYSPTYTLFLPAILAPATTPPLIENIVYEPEKISDFQGLDSFVFTSRIISKGVFGYGLNVDAETIITTEYIREPLSIHQTLSSDEPGFRETSILEGAGREVDIYYIENTFYINLYGWLVFSKAPMMDVEEVERRFRVEALEWIERAEYIDRKMYNDIPTYRFKLDEGSFDPQSLPENMQINQASGELYLSQEGNYLVHLDLIITGTNLLPSTSDDYLTLNPGSLNFSCDLDSVNKLKSVNLPSTARDSRAAKNYKKYAPFVDRIPIPAGAELATIFGYRQGIDISYEVDLSLDDVISFYQDAMPKNNWKIKPASSEGEIPPTYWITRGNLIGFLMLRQPSDSDRLSIDFSFTIP